MTVPNENQLTRRAVLQTGAGLAVAGAMNMSEAEADEKKPRLGIYEAIGVKPFINAAGTITYMGGSVMPPEVVAAWSEAARHFVDVYELQDKVGARIARLLGAEGAMVTTGASGAILLGTAAIVSAGEAKAIARLPDTTGLKSEVIIQKSHHSCYDNQLLDVGVKLIEVETAEDAGKAINDRTALMFFMNVAAQSGKITREAWAEMARRHRVPALIDAAADIPPLERIAEYFRMGYDLIALSGGKAMRGPNDTGLLLGRKEFIEWARRNANPHCGTIGRMMKVGKEDMIALLAAVDRFVHLDPVAERKEWERRIEVIEKAVREVPTVKCERMIPPIANHVPHLIVNWNEEKVKLSVEQATKLLREGDPEIRIGRVAGTGEKGILISVLTLQDGEEKIVAGRLSAILRKGG